MENVKIINQRNADEIIYNIQFDGQTIGNIRKITKREWVGILINHTKQNEEVKSGTREKCIAAMMELYNSYPPTPAVETVEPKRDDTPKKKVSPDILIFFDGRYIVDLLKSRTKDLEEDPRDRYTWCENQDGAKRFDDFMEAHKWIIQSGCHLRFTRQVDYIRVPKIIKTDDSDSTTN